MKLLVVVVTVMLAGSAAAQGLLDDLNGQVVDCGKCNQYVMDAQKYITNDTHLDSVVDDLQQLLCGGHIFDHYPKVHQQCEKYVSNIVHAARDFIDTIANQGQFCSTVLQCNRTINGTVLKAKLLQQGLIFVSKLGTYDKGLTNAIVTFFTDKEAAATMIVQKICQDASVTVNATEFEKQQLAKICNFEEGESGCSLCLILSNIIESDLGQLREYVRFVLLDACEQKLSPQQCDTLIVKILGTVRDMATVAVKYGFFCKKLDYCTKDNIFTRRCANFNGVPNVVCEFVSLLRCTLNQSVCEQMQRETHPLTLNQTLNYCQNLAHHAEDYIIDRQDSIQEILLEVCGLFHGEIKAFCYYTIGTRYQHLFHEVLHSFHEGRTCCALGFCNSALATMREDRTLFNLCNIALGVGNMALSDPIIEKEFTYDLTHLLKVLVDDDVFSYFVDSFFTVGYDLLLNYVLDPRICGGC